MPLEAYVKPYLSSLELCEKMREDGISISNLDAAGEVVETIGYYRFKAYLVPFQIEDHRRYHEDATFDKAHQLYLFDQDLRLLIFKLIQKFEIALRSSLDYWITGETNNPFWYLDGSLFKGDSSYIDTISGLERSFRRSKEEFATHYKSKYYNEFCPFYRSLPPAWVSIEIMSFGQVKSLLDSFNSESKSTLNLDRFSKKIGAKDFDVLKNWLGVIHMVRNICCHHSRLFNRNILAPTSVKKILKPDIELVKVVRSGNDQLNRIYTTLAVLQKMLSGIGFDKFGMEVASLFDSYPTSFLFMDSMGFPSQWRDEGLFF